MTGVWDPAFIDPTMDCRAATFENPTGGRGQGGTAHGGRKGAPSRRLASGERVVLADIDGPGTIRHVWMTFPPAPPETMRALLVEAFYDGADQPSISVPCLDLFGLPHGRPVAHHSALVAAQEGRGFNSYVPMPFAGHVRFELVNAAPRLQLAWSPVVSSSMLYVAPPKPTQFVAGKTVPDGAASVTVDVPLVSAWTVEKDTV